MNPMNALKFGLAVDYPGMFYKAGIDNVTAFVFDLRLSNEMRAPHGGAATPAGTTGATTYQYQATGVVDGKETEPSAVFQTTTGNATLSSTNYVALTAYMDPRFDSVNFYRNDSGTYKLIGTKAMGDIDHVTGKVTLNDTGLAVGAAAPSANATKGRSCSLSCHRVTVVNEGANVAYIHLSKARDETEAAAQATRDFTLAFNSTSAWGNIFRLGAGESQDLPVGDGLNFLTAIAVDGTGTVTIRVIPGRA